ncbi:hypothetical protein B0H14DRAFT_2740612 [Mycena olivaceomarginata]|nr:hypothetical protein B0H14DRAFT_2740612 [Mycena olivaceomarginata]
MINCGDRDGFAPKIHSTWNLSVTGMCRDKVLKYVDVFTPVAGTLIIQLPASRTPQLIHIVTPLLRPLGSCTQPPHSAAAAHYGLCDSFQRSPANIYSCSLYFRTITATCVPLSTYACSVLSDTTVIRTQLLVVWLPRRGTISSSFSTRPPLVVQLCATVTARPQWAKWVCAGGCVQVGACACGEQ